MKRFFFFLLLLLSFTAQMQSKIIVGLTESKAPYLIEDYVVFDGVTYKFTLGSCKLDYTAETPTSITIYSGSFEAVEYNDELASDVVILSSISKEKAAITSPLLQVHYPDNIEELGEPETISFPVTGYDMNELFVEKIHLTSVVLPERFISIPEFAFFGCISLKSISIPNTVTQIEDWAFEGCSSLTSIILPDGVTSIGDFVFSGCSSLTSINIPNSVMSIGESAFNGCSSLTSIKIPDGVTSIGDYTFTECSSLTYMTIPNSVMSIGEHAFTDCSSLTSIILPDGVTSIGDYTFYGCSSLTSINIPDGVTSIGKSAFAVCNSLASVTIGNSVTSIGDFAFSDCRSLTSVIFPNSVTCIGDYTFSSCSNLTSVIIPNSVTCIGEQAFRYCSGLSSIAVESGNSVYDSRDNCNAIIETSNNKLIAGCNNTIIPNSVVIIGVSAFSCRSGLTSVTIPNSVTSIGDNAFYNCERIISINIPDGVTSIGCKAFSQCLSLTSVTIPNSVTNIGDEAFHFCNNIKDYYIFADNLPELGEDVFKHSYINHATLHVPASALDDYRNTEPWNQFGNIVPIEEEPSELNYHSIGYGNVEVVALEEGRYEGDIVIPEKVVIDGIEYNVTKIGDTAFSECKDITSVVIPKSIKTIGSHSFKGCTGLSSLYIPSSVSSIQVWSFYGCSGLTSIKVDPENQRYDSRNDCNAIINKLNNGVLLGCMNTIIPDGVSKINWGAFYNCTNLSSIEIPESVTSIGNFAFEGCTNLQFVQMSKNIETIEQGAFSRCAKLNYIELPDNLTVIEESVFGGCQSLTSIRLPNSITEISDGLFGGCSSLASFTFPEHTTKIGRSSFSGCKALGNVSIPETVTTIGARAFSECESLKNLIVPNSVTDLGEGCFVFCINLESIVLPKHISCINDNLFASCHKLKEINIPQGVNSINYNAFTNCRGLESIMIPSSVENIGKWAFWNCKALSDVYCLNESLPILGDEVFEQSNVGNATLHVPASAIEQYQNHEGWKKFGSVVPLDIEAEEDVAVYFSEDSEIDDHSNLDGIIIGNIFYNITTGNGAFNATEGCITVTTPTADEQMQSFEGQDIFGEDFKSQFTGIVFKVPAGSGMVKVTAETTGNMTLKVKIGNGTPIEMELEGKLKASFPYNVAEPTYVYIYAGQTAAGVKGLAPVTDAEGTLKIYGIELSLIEDGIEAMDDGQWTMDNVVIYNLSGQRLSKPQRGVNIINGKKVLIK